MNANTNRKEDATGIPAARKRLAKSRSDVAGMARQNDMRPLSRAAAVALIGAAGLGSPTVAVAHVPQRAKHRHRVRLPSDFAAWRKVGACEEGARTPWRAARSWIPTGDSPTGGYTLLGIDGANWIYFSRRLHLPTRLPAPGRTTLRERIQAVMIGNAIDGGFVPDQSDCGNW